jgi:ParB-like chromosome segregation protein Spo0J
VELVPRTAAPLHATGAVEFVPLEAVSADPTFRLRDLGDVEALAGSIARLGQLAPIELRPLPGAGDGPARLQVVVGFRRLAAVRLLARGRVLARVHGKLDDDDAWGLALTQALLGEPLGLGELEALRARLAASRVAPWAEALIEEALVRVPVAPALREQFLAFLQGAPAPAAEPAAAARPEEGTEAEAPAAEAPDAEAPDDATEELTAEELATDLAARLWQVNQDLSLAVDAWDELPSEARRMIVNQARYMAELYPFLTRGRR